MAEGTAQSHDGTRSPPMPRQVPFYAQAALLVLMTLVAYLPALSAGFIWDDDRYVTNNPLMRAPDGLWRIWFSTDSPSQYVPLVYSTFWLEYSVWELFAAGYHFVNVLLHAANAFLLWRLLQRLAVPGAWLAAALFALHPVQVESVAWISERKNVLSLLFSLLALLAWVEFIGEEAKPAARLYRRALIFYLLALSSKATACTLPAALLLVLWLKGKAVTRQRLAQIAPFVALGISMGLIAMWWERFHQGTEGGAFSIGLLERILIASRAVWFYLGKLFWPANLTFTYPQWTVNLANPLNYVGLTALAAACAVIFFARRRIGRGMGVAGLFYVATLSPLLGFIMLYTFRYTYVADHYQYVACIGPLALAAAGITTALNRVESRKGLLQPICCAALLLTLGVLTWQQAGIYHDRGTLWRDTLKKNPQCWMAENNLGNFLAQQGNTGEAMNHYQRALEIKPDYAEAHYNLADAFARQNQPDFAIEHLEAAVRINPQYVKARNNLGVALLGAGRLDEAVSQFERVLELNPRSIATRVNLAVALNKQGRLDAAIASVQRAVALDPNDVQARKYLSTLQDMKSQSTNSETR
jgi:tetratricopeptide (TPR) repeat protein